MGIRLNLFCNGSLRGEAHHNWEEKYDQINFPGAPKRDAFGILIKEEKEDANLQE